MHLLFIHLYITMSDLKSGATVGDIPHKISGFALQQLGNLGLIYVHTLAMPQVYFEVYGGGRVLWLMGGKVKLIGVF